MKKLIKLLITAMCVFVLAAGIVACGQTSDGSDSSDKPTESVSASESLSPSASEKPSQSASESEEPKHEHVFGTEWKSDGTFHWHECECGEKSDKSAHVLTALTVKTQPTKTAYLVGEFFDKAGMEIEGTCVCGTINVTDYDVEYADGATSLKYGDTSVTIRRGNVTTTVAVTVERSTVEKPAADTTVFTYNGNEQTYAIAASELYTVSGNKQTNAGEYTVTVVLKDKEHTAWADDTTDDLTFTFTIAKLSAEVVWTTAGEYIYKDTALAAPTAKIAGADGKDIALTVTGDELNSKGEHTFTATMDNGNYTLTNTTCTVTVKLYNEITGLEFADIAYGEAPSYNAGELYAVHGVPTITYSLEEKGEYVAWDSIEKKVGKYYVKAYVAEDDGYISVTAYTSFNVAKGNNTAHIESRKPEYTCDERPIIAATATHGEVIVKYSETENGEFGVTMTFVPGNTYYAKATVAESEFYKGAESSVISFSIANHVYEDGKCTVCGAYNTMGVVYGYNSTYDCYYVGANTTLDVAELTILSRYNDGTNGEKAVKYIAKEAFKDNLHIKKVILGASIDSLEANVFWGCENLEYISMTGITNLEYASPYGGTGRNNNFRNCFKLKTVIVSTAFSTNVGQFGCAATDAGNKNILEFFVDGTSGAPSLVYDPADANNLCSGNVYFKGDGTKCGQWNFGSSGEIVKGASSHDFNDDGKCTICGAYETNGVTYSYDGSSYYVAGYSGESSVVNVLKTYNDGINGEANVTYVAELCAWGTTVKKIILPDSVTDFKGNSFQSAANLEYISMTGVTHISTGNNFINNTKITTVIVNKDFVLDNQQFKMHGMSVAPTVVIYVDGKKSESTFSYNGAVNEFLTGIVYYKVGDTETVKCLQWKFGENGEMVKGASAHEFVDGICKNCGEKDAMGVSYMYDSNSDSYYVAGYNGSSETVNVFGTWNDGTNGEKNVTFVKFCAFNQNNVIKKVVLHENITALDGGSFANCPNLEYISMIGVTDLRVTTLKELPHKDIYPDNDFTNHNFMNCPKLKTVVVGKNLTIGDAMFMSTNGDAASADIYTLATSETDGTININADNNATLTGNVYYYSETELSGAWHYVDGVVTLW